jgi:hypothetical protein
MAGDCLGACLETPASHGDWLRQIGSSKCVKCDTPKLDYTVDGMLSIHTGSTYVVSLLHFIGKLMQPGDPALHHNNLHTRLE